MHAELDVVMANLSVYHSLVLYRNECACRRTLSKSGFSTAIDVIKLQGELPQLGR